MDLTPIFNQYLRHADLPTLELKEAKGQVVAYRWKADEPKFEMPVKAGVKSNWKVLHPTAEWKNLPAPIAKANFAVATDLYYINVKSVD